MKFRVDQQILSKALVTVSKAITTRTTIPVLKGILLTVAPDGKIKLSASDLDLSIERTIEAETLEEGSIVVEAKLFNDIIRKMPPETVEIEVMENQTVRIKTMNSEFNIVSQSADEFPAIGDIDDVHAQLAFDKEILKDMIRKTQFCASIDESKGVIVGVLLEMGRDSFNMVALDGFRMAVTRQKMTSEEEREIIISARILNEIGKIISESETEEDVKVILSDKKAVVLMDRTKIVTRLLEGEFIHYKDILPKEHSTEIKVNRALLVEAIERAALLAREGKNNLIRIKTENNLMNITSLSEEGSVKEDIIIDKQGDDLEIGFNSKYILDALKAIDDDEVKLELNTAIKPCLIKPIAGEQYEYLVLPVRIPSAR